VEVPFVDATCVNPEIPQLILGRLLGAKLNLSIASLAFAGLISYIFKNNFVIAIPSM
jgi:hypothetical protein